MTKGAIHVSPHNSPFPPHRAVAPEDVAAWFEIELAKNFCTFTQPCSRFIKVCVLDSARVYMNLWSHNLRRLVAAVCQTLKIDAADHSRPRMTLCTPASRFPPTR